MARILIVDDEPLYCTSLARLARRNGHDVETSKDSSGAFRLSEEFTPDLLVVDWMLGESLTGLEVADRLRRHHPRLATLLISGNPSPELQAQLDRTQETRFLAKPFDAREFTETVRAILAENTRPAEPTNG